MLKDEKEQRKEDVKNIIAESTARWKQQDSTNMSVHNRLGELRDELMAKIEKLSSKHDFFEVNIRKEL